MVIAIELLRKPEGLAIVKDSEKRRFRDGKLVDQVLDLDQKWIKAQFATEQKRKEVNTLQKDITKRKTESKGSDKCEDLLGQKGKLEAEEEELKKQSAELQDSRDKLLGGIGNLLHKSVPVFEDEEHNERVALWGKPRKFTAKYGTNGFRPHFELLEMIGAVEFEAGQDIAGNRAYFLTGPGVLLNQAMINYALAFLCARGYTPVQPPFFMKKDLMAKTAELADYDDVLYKVVEDKEKPELDKYLIATSEQPLSAFHRNQNLDQSRFPIRYVGTSSCFRREAGSSGRDIRGIFRVHQFEKVEQFVLTHPDNSWPEHDNMIKTAEEFYQSLQIPYHTIAIVSKEINNAAAKKYDLEAWFPGDNYGAGQYRELVSCSNCTDYQARCMNTKCGFKPEDPFAHMLNSTLCATERAMCCLVENYQEEGGVRVPRALVPYTLGMEFFPFVKVLKEDEKAGKAGKKDAGAKKDAMMGQPKAKTEPKAKADAKKGSPKASPKSSPKAAPAAPPAAGGDMEAQIKAVGDDIRILKEKLKADGLSGKKINEHAEVKALVDKLQALKSGAPAAAPKAKADAPKKDKKGKDGDEEKVLTPEEAAEARKKQLKTAVKEGGKRGVEIEGAADMGGLQFFCTSVDAPNGDLEILEACLTAMNAKSDPADEERKGGSGHIGKMIFSAGTDQLALAAYVPEEKLKELSCEEWIKSVLGSQGGKVHSVSKNVCLGFVTADGNKNIFPLKIREPMILEANNFLRKLGLFPEDNDDSDEMVFGDDDFPSM